MASSQALLAKLRVRQERTNEQLAYSPGSPPQQTHHAQIFTPPYTRQAIMSDTTIKRPAPDGSSEPEAKQCSWGGSSGGGRRDRSRRRLWRLCSSSGGVDHNKQQRRRVRMGWPFAALASASSGGGFAVSPTPTSEGNGGQAAFDGRGGVRRSTACTGEEDEICVHRVRAKLFRLEVRKEKKRRPAAKAAEEGGGEKEEGAAAADETTSASPAVVDAAASKAQSGGEAICAERSRLCC